VGCGEGLAAHFAMREASLTFSTVFSVHVHTVRVEDALFEIKSPV